MNIEFGTTKKIAGTEFIILDKVTEGILCQSSTIFVSLIDKTE